jgi:DNA-binding XRE family transcriptional regulator
MPSSGAWIGSSASVTMANRSRRRPQPATARSRVCTGRAVELDVLPGDPWPMPSGGDLNVKALRVRRCPPPDPTMMPSGDRRHGESPAGEPHVSGDDRRCPLRRPAAVGGGDAAQALLKRGLVRRVGTTQATISRIEMGSVGATLTTLQRIATSLGVDLELSFRLRQPG